MWRLGYAQETHVHMYTNYHCTSSIMHMVRNYNWDFISTVFRGEQIQRSVVVYRVLSICLYICVCGWAGKGRGCNISTKCSGLLLEDSEGWSILFEVSDRFQPCLWNWYWRNYPYTTWTTWESLTSFHRWEAVSFAKEYSKEGYLSYIVHPPQFIPLH